LILILELPELPIQPVDGVLLLLGLSVHGFYLLEVSLVIALECILELLLLLKFGPELSVFSLHLLEALLGLLDHVAELAVLVLSHHLA
jgi:hypothetical protein